MRLSNLKKDVKKNSSPTRAKISQRYFKTGPGEYAQGDIFVGLSVPKRRILAKKYRDSKLSDTIKLLHSKIHEERNIALFILVDKYKTEPSAVYNLYLKNTKYINNWDLVDGSAEKIVGQYLLKKPKRVLYKLARSNNLWERRIAILSTHYFIRNNEFMDTLKIAKILFNDEHDLIHKAVGWMLREVGKKSLTTEKHFLKKYCRRMPKTMLRYAIEKFPKKERGLYS